MKINPKKWYSVHEVVQEGLVPVLDTDYKVKKWIDRGLLDGNSIGKGNGKRYFISGNNLIKFLAKWESGDFHT